MNRILLIALAFALGTTAYAASRSVDPSQPPPVGSVDGDITVPLSLFVVHEAGGVEGSNLSSRRTEAELAAIAVNVGEIWSMAQIRFEPVAVHTVELPRDVVADLMSGDATSFMDGSGPAFSIPGPGAVNGFYIPFAGGANGFTTHGSRVFFVADESSVHDERVTSHEIGHIFGLAHATDDPGRLMFGGTNGMALTNTEIDTARTGAASLPGVGIASPNSTTIANSGSTMEGHTPRGFTGSGTGLFVGDNLNPDFPEGDGVQLFLSFKLPAGLNAPVNAVLSSDAIQVSGDGDPAICKQVGENGLTCDVSAAVSIDVAAGATRSQFRLRFDLAADGDGKQDLAMFNRSDSNQNDPGIFELRIDGS